MDWFNCSMDKREAIVKALNAGKTSKVIQDELKVSRKLIYNVKIALKERGNVRQKPGSGRPVSVATNRLVNLVRSRLARNPIRSMRGMAREVGVSEFTIRKVVKERLGTRSLARTPNFLLTDRLKGLRLERSRRILNVLKKKTPNILFSDEKYFTVDPVSNSRHNRFITKQRTEEVPEAIRISQKSKHPAAVMVFGLVASNGLKMPPVFLPTGFRMGAREYLEQILKAHVLPWVRANFDKDEDVILMQDGAPCHTAKVVQTWLDANLKYWPKDMWPPSSPDLNPLDFSIWASVQAKACDRQHPNLDSLRTSVAKAWADLSADSIRTVCSRFRARLEAVINANGGYID